MADSGILDRLASGLSLDERHKLLKRLEGQSTLSAEPLYVADDGTVFDGAAAAEYSRLPWYVRLWFFILSVLKAKTPEKIFMDRRVSVLGAKIDEKYPGLYDCRRALLLPAFRRRMGELKDAARFFYSALDISVNRDKGAFFAFLGSLEMAGAHKALQTETAPETLAAKFPSAAETELRQMALKAVDDVLSAIGPESRNAMYLNARSLYSLKELSSFLFDRVVAAFGFNPAVNGETCYASLVMGLLATLNDILSSLKSVPSMSLLESLFVFSLQERTEEPGFDLDRETRLLLAKAEKSLECIREYNRQVPLTWILRCAGRDMSLSPREISGGEDWFAVYRDFWKRRIEAVFADYIKGRRRRELLEEFRRFLNGGDLALIENIASETNPDGMPIKGSFDLSFLRGFHSAVFMPDINGILKTILAEGEFSRKENRAEFAGSYSSLVKLDDDIKTFERQISPSGDYGQRWILARQDMSSLPAKRRKSQVALDEASADAFRIRSRTREAVLSGANILNGILGRDARNRYFSLTNLTKMAGKNGGFFSGIEEAIRKLQWTLKLLDDIELMESAK